jgi:uncharacterized DUF497 family protein
VAEFRWNRWNTAHIAEHGVTPAEAEHVVEHPLRGYPRKIGDDKLTVRGRTDAGRYLQVIHIFDPPGIVYVIHARPLTESEKHALRRGRRR